MGTNYRITVVVAENLDLSHLEQQIIAQLQSVNQSMSTYLQNSELSQFNRQQANVQVELSEPLRAVISEALEISELSQGAFDITVADAVRLWGFGADGIVTRRPSDQRIAELKASSGYSNLTLETNRLSKAHSGTSIDLSGIAKGYAVDRVAQMLTASGVHDYLIDVGGELRASGRNADQQIWLIAIEKPQMAGGIQQIVELQDSAIATSGDYRNYLTIEGKKYSHTIDPVTLKPVFHRLALVSVLSERASRADALATALMVMGEDRAVEFAEQQDLAAYFVIRTDNDNQWVIKYTQKFAAILR
ncbi:MAG: FAD:protein FMN transferase [Gammaproteobacteria bacterium]|nr:FAD:protein FMN transferase [Gammaproteobacteria bacterium]